MTERRDVSPTMFPKSFFPFPLPPEPAKAAQVSDVDRSNVVAGGVAMAKFPHIARNFRRSLFASTSTSEPFLGVI